MKIPVREVAVSAEGSTVYLELIVTDAYAAVVLKDDLVERLCAGQKLRLSLQGLPQDPVVEKVTRR